MKKIQYFALAALTMVLFACNSKPATADQSSDEAEYVEETHEDAVLFEEEVVENDTVEVVEEAVEVAEEAAEEPAEQVAEEPAEEPAPVVETAEVPSDKFAIGGTDGNFIAFVSEVVTADADRCIPLNMVMDKSEESNVKLIINIEEVGGRRIGVFPARVVPGGTKINIKFCPPEGGIFDVIKAGKQYKLTFLRAQV